MQYKNIFFIIILSVIIIMCGGCKSDNDNKAKTRIVLTTGFESDEIFRIGKASCTIPEMKVYLTNTKNQYESVYGEEIWEVEYKGKTVKGNIKETVLARMAQIKALTLLAKEKGVILEDEEKSKISEAATLYYDSLNDKEVELLGVDEALIYKMYEEYFLAEKVYNHIISDVNPEISDDEARTITVQHILIKTYTIDETGNSISFSEDEKKVAYEKAKEAYRRARGGEDFAKLITEYNEDEKSTYSFGKGAMDMIYEEASFNLGRDEISDIVETRYGYYIIKCINTFDKTETDKNKLSIIEQRQKQAFSKEYSEFVRDLTKNIHEKRWEKLEFINDEDVTTKDFFDIYHSICEK